MAENLEGGAREPDKNKNRICPDVAGGYSELNEAALLDGEDDGSRGRRPTREELADLVKFGEGLPNE